MKDMKKFVEFLKEYQGVILAGWEKSIFISENEPFKAKMTKNAAIMYELIVRGLEEGYNQDELKMIARRVAEERIRAEVNIGEFVYNVNIGRSEIFKCMNILQSAMNEMQPVIDRINQGFDLFLYYAVSHYTELKNDLLEEKATFIDATHKDRLYILGQMTSSFVHEFRNPLTSIKGFIQLLKTEYPDLKYIDIISSELEQLNFRVSQFLMLSKKEIVGKEKQEFYIEQLLEEVLNFLYPSLLNDQIHLVEEMHGKVQFYGYVDEIRQVFINILFNAIDALHTREKDKVVTIVLKECGGEIVISVSNNGPVIDQEVLHTIFEPFVTTKELGTGLGLFVCKQIIEKHGGRISIASDESMTTFSIYLPSYAGALYSGIEVKTPFKDA